MPTPSTSELLAQQTENITDLTNGVGQLTELLKSFIEVVVRDSYQPDVAIINTSVAQPGAQITTEQLWAHLANSGTMLLESDYRLMRQSLGRPDVDMTLDAVADAENHFVHVRGAGLATSVALNIDGRVVTPIRHDATHFVVPVASVLAGLTEAKLETDPLITILSFGQRGITGRYSARFSDLFNADYYAKGLV